MNVKNLFYKCLDMRGNYEKMLIQHRRLLSHMRHGWIFCLSSIRCNWDVQQYLTQGNLKREIPAALLPIVGQWAEASTQHACVFEWERVGVFRIDPLRGPDRSLSRLTYIFTF